MNRRERQTQEDKRKETTERISPVMLQLPDPGEKAVWPVKIQEKPAVW